MKYFIDSSFFISLLKEDDSNHHKATIIFDELDSQIVTLFTSYNVIDETATVLSLRASKKIAIDFLKKLNQPDFPAICDLEHSDRTKVYDLFIKTKSKNISIIDCASVVSMQKHQIRKCLTFDKHFKEFGFEII